uniref:Putative ovule protein n=1 Tax=Solanum chacoense TaxID=4108 RepID=A0A0V0H3P1_SOLCH
MHPPSPVKYREFFSCSKIRTRDHLTHTSRVLLSPLDINQLYLNSSWGGLHEFPASIRLHFRS